MPNTSLCPILPAAEGDEFFVVDDRRQVSVLQVVLHRTSSVKLWAQVFVNCLTATANDICKEQKRQTISADDIFAALQDLELVELVGPLKDALERALQFYTVLYVSKQGRMS